jgi:Spy/CpxP family protein refolding chaperone
VKRWERPLLLFSVALNVGFVSLAAVHFAKRPGPPPPFAGADSPRARALMQRWQQHRHEALARALDLDATQRQQFGAGFDTFHAPLRAARREVMAQRHAYGSALARGDVDGARLAQAKLSAAQTRLDSLCAQMMLQETSMLRPEQRARYVQWMFRPGASPGEEFGPGGGHGPHGGPGPGAPPPAPNF